MKKEFVINSQDEINLILDEIFSEIKTKKIVLLEGELGAGKTTFVKYLAKR
ncbi:tRNA (adenosine(37)-N6)-threonylcarbamoyltransferase complex ATPase subunit type 1 TsaE, partial [Mycoplasmopsis pullorum]|uniref:tRNA (adenosine(37)-N6)-threonylcarbamoyltransferase complex ATPase subunit type 1 TsaE n=2 Tax=Mycoplasmopsis TaxID=2767358 RepID=UPI00111A6D66